MRVKDLKYKLFVSAGILVLVAALAGMIFAIWFAFEERNYGYRINNVIAEAIENDCMYAELPDGEKLRIAQSNMTPFSSVLNISERDMKLFGLPKDFKPQETITVTVNNHAIYIYRAEPETENVYIVLDLKENKRTYYIDGKYNVFSRLLKILSEEGYYEENELITQTAN